MDNESANLAAKIFKDTCCESCMCQSSDEHKKEAVLQIKKNSPESLVK